MISTIVHCQTKTQLIPDKSAAFSFKYFYTSHLSKRVVLPCTIDITKAYLQCWSFSVVPKSSKDDFKDLNYRHNRDQHPGKP